MNILEIKNISKSYKKIKVLDDFSITLNDGCLGLLGPNGAGKTTLMRILSRVIKAESGEVILNGITLSEGKSEYLRQLSFMPQEFGFYPFFTAKEILYYFAKLRGVIVNEEKVDELLETVNLLEDKNKKVGTFSGGMKRRLGIAVSYLNDARLMILDEPTAGLDPKERFLFKKKINDIKKDRIIIVSTHIVSELTEMCDKICFINKGKLVRVEDKNEDGSFNIDLEQEYIKMVGE
ncbi:MAG: ATP-binding cassette domain-containing protein [Lachnospiraceae bacterium]|nr:ATP-binding cassette domain-containing protein [Lachnospiraceae bacterium]